MYKFSSNIFFNFNLLPICLFIFFINSLIGFSQKKAETKVSAAIATIQRDTVLVKLKDYNTQLKIAEAYQKQLQSEYEDRK